MRELPIRELQLPELLNREPPCLGLRVLQRLRCQEQLQRHPVRELQLPELEWPHPGQGGLLRRGPLEWRFPVLMQQPGLPHLELGRLSLVLELRRQVQQLPAPELLLPEWGLLPLGQGRVQRLPVVELCHPVQVLPRRGPWGLRGLQERPEWLHLVPEPHYLARVCPGVWLLLGAPHLVRGWRILVGEVRD